MAETRSWFAVAVAYREHKRTRCVLRTVRAESHAAAADCVGYQYGLVPVLVMQQGETEPRRVQLHRDRKFRDEAHPEYADTSGPWTTGKLAEDWGADVSEVITAMRTELKDTSPEAAPPEPAPFRPPGRDFDTNRLALLLSPPEVKYVVWKNRGDIAVRIFDRAASHNTIVVAATMGAFAAARRAAMARAGRYVESAPSDIIWCSGPEGTSVRLPMLSVNGAYSEMEISPDGGG
jgi:hypothetical protein